MLCVSCSAVCELLGCVQKLDVPFLVRSHECIEEGCEELLINENQSLFTIFSASNYDSAGNKVPQHSPAHHPTPPHTTLRFPRRLHLSNNARAHCTRNPPQPPCPSLRPSSHVLLMLSLL